MSEENKALVRRFYEGIVNEADLQLAYEVLDPNYVDHSPLPVDTPGPEGFKRRVEQLHEMFGIRMTLADVTAEDDRVAFRWTMRGRHIGEFAGVARHRSRCGDNGPQSRTNRQWPDNRALERVRQAGADGAGARN